MRCVLHILTKPADPLLQQLIANQIRQPDTKVEVVDLRQSDPDYAALLEKIFAADSVEAS